MIPNPGTKAWKAAFIKALQNPKFKYTLPNNIHNPILKLPDPPALLRYEKKIQEYRLKKYNKQVKETLRLNALKEFILEAYSEHYHANKK